MLDILTDAQSSESIYANIYINVLSEAYINFSSSWKSDKCKEERIAKAIFNMSFGC